MKDFTLPYPCVGDSVVELKAYSGEVDIVSRFSPDNWHHIVTDVDTPQQWEALLENYKQFIHCYLLYRLSDHKPIGFVYLLQEDERGSYLSIHGGGWEHQVNPAVLYMRGFRLIVNELLNRKFRILSRCDISNRRVEKFLRGAGFEETARDEQTIYFKIIPKRKMAVKKTKDGKVDKRTKEGKEIAARMAKARASKNSLKNRLKRLFK
ncbi:MAG: hypothetical protein ACI30X_05230 [Muribaculaceae bacterium]